MNHKERESVKNGILLGVIILLLALILGSAGSVSKMMNARKLSGEVHVTQNRDSYVQLEEDYQSALSEVLSKEGYPYSGITMTYISDEKGNREYRIKVHHRRLETLSAEKQTELVEAMREVIFEGGNCCFYLV